MQNQQEFKSYIAEKEDTFAKRINALLSNKNAKNQGILSDKQLGTLKRYHTERIAKNITNAGSICKMYFLKRFGLYLKKPYEKVTKEDIANYLAIIKKTVKSKTYQAYLKEFYKWLYGNEYGYPDIVKWLDLRIKASERKSPKDIITDEELKKLLDKAGEQRDRALIYMLHCSGARIGEIINLNVGNLSFDKYGAILKLKGKTGERKIRLIDCVNDLQLYMKNHIYKDNDDAPLFYSYKENRFGKRLERNGVVKMLARVSKLAGIKKNIHPHLFRHTRATLLAGKLMEQEMKVYMGWTSASKMAATYCHLSEDMVNNKLLEVNGIELEEFKNRKQEIKRPVECPRCKDINPINSNLCNKCGMALDLKTAMKMELKQKEETQKMVFEMLKQMAPQLQQPQIIPNPYGQGTATVSTSGLSHPLGMQQVFEPFKKKDKGAGTENQL